LQCVLNYIRDEAPIIIHFSVVKHLNFYIKDDCYKNLFEVYDLHVSGGSTNL